MLVEGFNSFMGLLILAIFILKLFAFIDCAVRKAEAFPAADKQTKKMWLVLLGVLLVADLVGFGGIGGLIALVGLIVAAIYVLDVRPAVKAVGRGGGRNMGPYGPW